jgi:hypothetical protein
VITTECPSTDDVIVEGTVFWPFYRPYQDHQQLSEQTVSSLPSETTKRESAGHMFRNTDGVICRDEVIDVASTIRVFPLVRSEIAVDRL